MKRILTFSAILTLLLALACGCSDAGKAPEVPTQSNTPQTNVSQPDTLPEEPEEPEEPEVPIVPYGKCGENLNWELTDDGVLTISGTGTMEYSDQPWSHYLESITSVVIEDGATSIGNDAFSGCVNLVSIEIPDSMSTIGDRAFSGCSTLTSIEIPGSVTIIGDAAFSDCTALTDIHFGGDDWKWSEVTVGAGNDCLSNAKIVCVVAEGKCGENLVWFLTDDGVLTISGTGEMTDPDRPQQSWKSYRETISSVIIEDGVTTIGNYAFYYCSSLTSVTIPGGITTIGDQAFYECTSLTSIEIPNSVTIIKKWAFAECTGLTSIIIPSGVTTIGAHAFHNCTSLTSIEIPDSVTAIEDYAFNGCDVLDTVYFRGTEEQWNAIKGEDSSLANAEIVFG